MMKRGQTFRISVEWKSAPQFAVVLQRRLAMARRAPEFFPEAFFPSDDGDFQVFAVLR